MAVRNQRPVRSAPMAEAPAAAPPRVTIALVADRAGVSVPTVSKVLNGRDEVSASTRRRVQDALTSTGYQRRNSAARTKVGLIDFVIPAIDTAWGIELLRGAEQEAHRHGVRLVLNVTHDHHARPRDWRASLAARPTDGVVLVITQAFESGSGRPRPVDIPMVVIDQVGGRDPATPTIGATNWSGGFAATQHLTDLGHKRIGMITGPPDVLSSVERTDGYRAALDRIGIEFDPRLIAEGDFYTESGRRGAEALLALSDPPTAIFAGSDMQARGVYEFAATQGLQIPHDLSVVGFDDVEVCEWMTPPLTTIRQPLAQMAALAVRNVIGQVPGEEPIRVELATSLIVRKSTAPPPLRPRSRRRRDS